MGRAGDRAVMVRALKERGTVGWADAVFCVDRGDCLGVRWPGELGQVGGDFGEHVFSSDGVITPTVQTGSPVRLAKVCGMPRGSQISDPVPTWWRWLPTSTVSREGTIADRESRHIRSAV